MELVAPGRETRPWPPRRVAAALAGVTLLGGLVAGATWAVHGYRARAAVDRSCDSLRQPVADLGTIGWNNGLTSGEANWSTVLADWHLYLGEEEQRRVTQAVRADAAAFDEVLADVESDIRPAVGYLHRGIVEPATPDPIDTTAVGHARALQTYLMDTCDVAP